MRSTLPALVLAAALGSCAPGAGPGGGAASPSPVPGGTMAAGPLLYVANQEAATVSIIDPAGDSLLTTVDLRALGFTEKAKPHDTAVEPDGSHWYVTLIGENLVVKLDRQNRVVGRASMETPGLLSLDPAGGRLWVTRSMSAVNAPSRVAMIDRATMDIEEIDVFVRRPHGVAVGPGGEYVYVGGMEGNQLATIEAATGEVSLTPLPPGVEPMVTDFAVSPDGSRIVMTDHMGSQAIVFDATSPTRLKPVATIAVGAWPWDVHYTPDGREVWFGNQRANTVTVLDAETWTVADVIEGRGLAMPSGIAISPDGREVYVSNQNLQGTYVPETARPRGTGTVVVIDRATRRITRVIETDRQAAGMSLTGRP